METRTTQHRHKKIQLDSTEEQTNLLNRLIICSTIYIVAVPLVISGNEKVQKVGVVALGPLKKTLPAFQPNVDSFTEIAFAEELLRHNFHCKPPLKIVPVRYLFKATVIRPDSSATSQTFQEIKTPPGGLDLLFPPSS